MKDLGKLQVIVEDLIHIIFEDLDPVRLKYVWDVDRGIYRDMIKIIKCRLKLCLR